MASASPAVRPVGRTVCPGSIPAVPGREEGPEIGLIQHIQKTYEDAPGFLAVLFDGTKPIVIVDRNQLLQWQARLAPQGIAVAPSCVDAALLAALMDALPAISAETGSLAGGYNAVDDRIDITSADPAAFVDSLEAHTGMRAAIRKALEDGTLVVVPGRLSRGLG